MLSTWQLSPAAEIELEKVTKGGGEKLLTQLTQSNNKWMGEG